MRRTPAPVSMTRSTARTTWPPMASHTLRTAFSSQASRPSWFPGKQITLRPSPAENSFSAAARRVWVCRAGRGSVTLPSNSSKQSPARTNTPGPVHASTVWASSVAAAVDAVVASRARWRSLHTRTRPPTGTATSTRSATSGPASAGIGSVIGWSGSRGWSTRQPAGRVGRVVEGFGHRRQRERAEGVDHHGQLVGALLPDRRLRHTGGGSVGDPARMKGEGAGLDAAATEERAADVEEDFVRVDVGVVIRRGDDIRPVVEPAGAERAHHRAVQLEGLVHGRRLVLAAGDGLEV